MARPLILVTGFGPFVDVDHNPSRDVALALGERADPDVTAAILPVSLRRSAEAFEELLAGLSPRVPDGVLCLGVHKGSSFRLERRARAALDSHKRDNDGVLARGTLLPGTDVLETRLDLALLGAALERGGAGEVMYSECAGGFVCERIYHHALDHVSAPSLFLHLPPSARVPVETQIEVVGALFEEFVRQVSGLVP